MLDFPGVSHGAAPCLETESPLRALATAWLAAKATHDALPPWRDESLADAAFDIALRLEQEIAACAPEIAVDFPLGKSVPDVAPADDRRAALVRLSRTEANLGP